MTAPIITERWAHVSGDGLYRYALGRACRREDRRAP